MPRNQSGRDNVLAQRCMQNLFSAINQWLELSLRASINVVLVSEPEKEKPCADENYMLDSATALADGESHRACRYIAECLPSIIPSQPGDLLFDCARRVVFTAAKRWLYSQHCFVPFSRALQEEDRQIGTFTGAPSSKARTHSLTRNSRSPRKSSACCLAASSVFAPSCKDAADAQPSSQQQTPLAIR